MQLAIVLVMACGFSLGVRALVEKAVLRGHMDGGSFVNDIVPFGQPAFSNPTSEKESIGKLDRGPDLQDPNNVSSPIEDAENSFMNRLDNILNANTDSNLLVTESIQIDTFETLEEADETSNGESSKQNLGIMKILNSAEQKIVSEKDVDDSNDEIDSSQLSKGEFIQRLFPDEPSQEPGVIPNQLENLPKEVKQTGVIPEEAHQFGMIPEEANQQGLMNPGVFQSLRTKMPKEVNEENVEDPKVVKNSQEQKKGQESILQLLQRANH